MSADHSPSLDVGEFLQLLQLEVDTATRSILLQDDPGPRMAISAVRVRLGSAPGEEENGAQSHAIMDPQLAPTSPWDLEVIFRPVNAVRTFEITETDLASWLAHATDRGATSFPFDELSVDAIQGIGAETRRSLAAHAITTVAELSDASTSSVMTAVGRQAPEFRTKARLARQPVPPLLPSPADDRSLRSLAGLSPVELAEVLGPTATRSRCTHLAAYLNLLLVSLDDRQLRRIPLGRLRDFQQAATARR